MTAKEAIRILETAKAEIEWSAPLEYQEALDEAIRALKDSEPIFHLECLRCKKPVGSYSRQTMEQVSYTHYSYCEDCLRKGLKMLKKQDALDKQSTSAEQADHIAEPGKMIDLKKRTATERLIIAKSLIDSVIADSDNDQFREVTKKTDSEVNCSDEWWKNYIRLRMRQDDVPDTNVGDTIYRQAAIDAVLSVIPYDEYWKEQIEEAVGNLPSTQPEIKTDGDMISRQAAIDACTKVKVGAFPHDAGVNNSIKALKALPSAQPECKTGAVDSMQ